MVSRSLVALLALALVAAPFTKVAAQQQSAPFIPEALLALLEGVTDNGVTVEALNVLDSLIPGSGEFGGACVIAAAAVRGRGGGRRARAGGPGAPSDPLATSHRNFSPMVILSVRMRRATHG